MNALATMAQFALGNPALGIIPTGARAVIVDGKDKSFLVPRSQAILGDVLGLGLAGLLFFNTENDNLKLASGIGAAWMGIGLMTKIGQQKEIAVSATF